MVTIRWNYRLAVMVLVTLERLGGWVEFRRGRITGKVGSNPLGSSSRLSCSGRELRMWCLNLGYSASTTLTYTSIVRPTFCAAEPIFARSREINSNDAFAIA